jgi:hypothetical protein
VDAPGLAAAVERLLSDSDYLEALTRAALGRSFKAWPTYADELAAWMRSLPRRG